MRRFRFAPGLPRTPAFTVGDGILLLGLAAAAYVGARLAFRVPAAIAGPEISLSPWALPWYAFLSLSRMLAAYLLSLLFTLTYGYAAARDRTAERLLMPLLDVLQSVPILSFLPIVLLGLSAVLPRAFAAEFAAIVLIFTSQAWNMTFSYYQSLTTIPTELREAAAVFRLDAWQRLKTLELPFAAIGLIWNSMMSWAGGWFFLMASEIFTVGPRDFRLPGLGSYLQTAADRGDLRAVALGLATLTFVVVAMDQLVWRPVLAWADRFKLAMTEDEEPPRSWFLGILSRSWLLRGLSRRALRPWSERLDARLRNHLGPAAAPPEPGTRDRTGRAWTVVAAAAAILGAYGTLRAATFLAGLPAEAWGRLGLGVLATLGRVAAALALALLWTIPLGVAIGTNRRLAAILQPAVQTVAAIPATALFPVFLLFLVRFPGGLNLAAILLMLMGTQWYLLFNVIAGASAIPQDLRQMTDLLGLSRRDRWRRLILPGLFPYIVTGAIAAGGGAWNASIVAEHADFAGRHYIVTGVGALISDATATADYRMLLAGTLALVLTVVLINRILWRRLYRRAEERYRME